MVQNTNKLQHYTVVLSKILHCFNVQNELKHYKSIKFISTADMLTISTLLVLLTLQK